MSTSFAKQLTGQLIAASFTGAWRQSAVPFSLSAVELNAITPLAIKAATGALLWWRIRDTELAQSESGEALHTMYRLHHLEARVHAYRIKTVLAHFRQAGIETVLIKGRSVARHYPEPGLRHYSDLDLCVAPNQYRQAQALVKSLGPLELYVDLHRALGRHDNLSWLDLLAHSEVVELDDLPVRVLGAEDHLRLLCVHWLRHGAWGPLGLCDIAAALEARGPNFDWQRALGPDKKHADWMTCALGLAHQLLGANIDDTPVLERANNLPQWLVPAVLAQWQTCINPNYREMALKEIPTLLLSPRKLFVELSARFSHPIRATIEVRGRFNELPRWPYQLGALLLRWYELPRQLALIPWHQLRKLAARGQRSDAATGPDSVCVI